MIDKAIKKQQEQEWLMKHTLTPEQLKQLFQGKLDRATAAIRSLRKQEAQHLMMRNT
jgi:hypothetical protein